MYEEAIQHLTFLKSIPNYQQRSKEWFEQRKNRLTSSDAATALGINPYKTATQLLFEKCGIERPYESNKNTLHGQKYEDEAVKRYEYLMGKQNNMFGMISFNELDPVRQNKASKKYIDKKYSFLGGSPDGVSIDKIITENSVLSQLEVKCPLMRKIKHGKIPEYYVPQVQLNMFILDLEITDFVEFVPNINGKNMEMNIVRLYRDEAWFDKNFPVLENFWNQVNYWRTRDIKEHPEYNIYNKTKITPIYKFIEDNSEEDKTEDKMEVSDESMF
jgi:putative phage-type endonuclease